jgi:hypothetical protein
MVAASTCLLLLVVCSGAGAAPRLPKLSPEGLGAAHFGMRVDQAESALSTPIEVAPSVGGCSFWTLPGGVEGIAFGGRLAYIGVGRRGIKTTRGVEVGDGLVRLRHRYRGRLHGGRSGSLAGPVTRLFSTERRGDARYELEFDIDAGRVASISAGTRHTIETFGECA